MKQHITKLIASIDLHSNIIEILKHQQIGCKKSSLHKFDHNHSSFGCEKLGALATVQFHPLSTEPCS